MTRIYKAKDGKEIQILVDHVQHGSGNFKGVCVSAVLAYFNITPDQYNTTSSKKNLRQYENVLRRFGYSVRSRKSVFKKATSVGQVRNLINKYSDVSTNVKYMIMVWGHLLLLDSEGNTLVDTSPRKRDRRKIIDIKAVF